MFCHSCILLERDSCSISSTFHIFFSAEAAGATTRDRHEFMQIAIVQVSEHFYRELLVLLMLVRTFHIRTCHNVTWDMWGFVMVVNSF